MLAIWRKAPPRPKSLKPSKKGRNLRPWRPEARNSTHAAIIHIFVANEYARAKARLIFGGAELLIWMDFMCKLRLVVDFGKRYFHCGQGEWQAIVRNGENRWVFPLTPTVRGYAKLEEYFANTDNVILKFRPRRQVAIAIARRKRLHARNQSGEERKLETAEIHLKFGRYVR